MIRRLLNNEAARIPRTYTYKKTPISQIALAASPPSIKKSAAKLTRIRIRQHLPEQPLALRGIILDIKCTRRRTARIWGTSKGNKDASNMISGAVGIAIDLQGISIATAAGALREVVRRRGGVRIDDKVAGTEVFNGLVGVVGVPGDHVGLVGDGGVDVADAEVGVDGVGVGTTADVFAGCVGHAGEAAWGWGGAGQ